MTFEEFRELVGSAERQGVEYKGPRRRQDRGPRLEVIRAVLAMSNRRDGGKIIIGVAANGEFPGLTEEQVESWSNHDHVRECLAPYADPFVNVTPEILRVPIPEVGERCFVVLHVDEFRDQPVLCRKGEMHPDGRPILKRGALYVRSLETVASEEVCTQAQMRDLLDLAVTKGVRDFWARLQSAGVSPSEPPSVDRYPEQLESFRATSGMMPEIRSRGHLEATIRPRRFREDRLELESLFERVTSNVVQFRGWDFPHVEGARDTIFGQDSIKQGTAWQEHREVWELFQSGLFASVRGIHHDWRQNTNSERVLPTLHTFYTFVEIFEFAARLTGFLEPNDEILIGISFHGLNRRRLITENMSFLDRLGVGVCKIDNYPQELKMTRAELLADPIGPAIKAARRLFSRFGGIDISEDSLRDALRDLRRR